MGWAGGPVLDAEGAFGHFVLEADSDGPTPEAHEAAMLGRWETTELQSVRVSHIYKSVRVKVRAWINFRPKVNPTLALSIDWLAGFPVKVVTKG